MQLNTITASRDDLRAALETYDESLGLTDEGDDSYWSFYRADDYDSDSTFVSAVRALDEWLTEHPTNPHDSVDITLVADVDGSIEGYEFQYAIMVPYNRQGPNPPWLALSATFSEWKTVRGDHDGIEGVIDFLEGVIFRLNASIEGYNYWATA